MSYAAFINSDGDAIEFDPETGTQLPGQWDSDLDRYLTEQS